MNKKSKVLISSENFVPLSTASAQRGFAFTHALTQHSFVVTVITKSPVYGTSEKLIVHGFVTKRDLPVFDPILLFFYLIRSANILRKNKFDLIVSTVPKINNAITGVILSKLFRLPHIIDIRDYWESTLISYPLSAIVPRPLTLLMIKLVSLLYRQADSIITVNETLKKMLHRRGIPLNKIWIIPNGADTSTFRPCENKDCVKKLRRKYGLPPSKTIFVYGGSFTVDYNFEILLKGLSYLKDNPNVNQNLLLLLVGRPTVLLKEKTLRQLTRKLEIQDLVKIRGPTSVDKLAELLRCCDVGVIPLADSEAFRHVTTAKIFTYLASGLPILASGPENGELENFIKQYRVGYFLENCTPKSFADGFKRFMQEKDKTREMGMRGRTIMEKSFDRYLLANKLIEVIQAIAKT